MAESVPSPFFRSETASLMRRNRLWLTLAATPLMLGFIATCAAILNWKAAFLAPVFQLSAVGLALLGFAYRRNRSPTFLGGEITADPTGVHFNRSMLVRREDIKHGFVVPQHQRTVVRLVKKGFALSENIVVKDVQEGRALLRALGLDASQAVAEVKAMSPVFSLPTLQQLGLFLAPALFAMLGTTVGFSAFGHNGPLIGSLAMVIGYLIALPLMVTRTQVRVGADGIFTHWFNRQRFFPFSQIERVNPYVGRQLNKTYVGVELKLRSGEVVRLLTGQQRWSDEEANLLVERIRESIEAYASGMAGADASILNRNGRTPKAWLTSLRGLGAGANADMRTSPIPLEKLWGIVEDASASAVARLSAAIALSPCVPPSERGRIRIAAQTTASPKLRIALEQATQHEVSDEVLAESLSDLESESEPPKAHLTPDVV